jgi:hypothetical protein
VTDAFTQGLAEIGYVEGAIWRLNSVNTTGCRPWRPIWFIVK